MIARLMRPTRACHVLTCFRGMAVRLAADQRGLGLPWPRRGLRRLWPLCRRCQERVSVAQAAQLFGSPRASLPSHRAQSLPPEKMGHLSCLPHLATAHALRRRCPCGRTPRAHVLAPCLVAPCDLTPSPCLLGPCLAVPCRAWCSCKRKMTGACAGAAGTPGARDGRRGGSAAAHRS